MGAGLYSERFRRMVCVKTLNTTNGQKEESFEDGAFLWGFVEFNSGRRNMDYGGTQTGIDCTITLRGYPVIKAIDRIYSLEYDVLYIIVSIRFGNNVTILDCVRFDSLDLS